MNHRSYQKVLFACTVPLQSRKSAPRTEIAELAIRVGTKTSSCDHLMSKGVNSCILVRSLYVGNASDTLQRTTWWEGLPRISKDMYFSTNIEKTSGMILFKTHLGGKGCLKLT